MINIAETNDPENERTCLFIALVHVHGLWNGK